MTAAPQDMFRSYSARLATALEAADWAAVERLALAIRECWRTGRRVYLCGNGGSAANAMHIANDFLYGTAKGGGKGIRVTALPSNVSVLTCLANDEGYADIFSRQLLVDGEAGDILIVLSGSGNSPNILEALKQASAIGIRTFAILGYSGGKAKEMADEPIHFAINDMQISEDAQLVVAHAIMQWLCQNPPESK